MQTFQCGFCGQNLFFENTVCERCHRTLGYAPDREELYALEPSPTGFWQPNGAENERYRFCANHALGICNWLISEMEADEHCRACRHNQIVPNTPDGKIGEQWLCMERAKRALFYSLIRLALPLKTRADDPEHGLAFNFLSDRDTPTGKQRPITGHDKGIITLALAEADDSEREKIRHAMHEPYRTLLGHFRHEIGHYYWDLLVAPNPGLLARFRALFGDERQDYEQALKVHYEKGAPISWQDRFISNYASSHPWEDFAESWAHYLHIVDTLETAQSSGLAIATNSASAPEVTAPQNPYHERNIETLIEAWLPFTLALNSLNRSMGQPDLYPFVLSPAARKKLGFVLSVAQSGSRNHERD